ncbi:hypothetical protein F66182_15370, partial [Fusarium sp. NRRL 66182]
MMSAADSSVIWTHPYPQSTPLEAFRRYVNATHSLDLKSYNDLHTWSVTSIEHFAAAVWTFCGIKYSVPPTTIATGLDKMWPPPRWFPGARMNYTENILSFGLDSRPDAIAITAVKEGLQDVKQFTFLELKEQVAVWATTLKKFGVRVGDRIA